MKTHSLAGVIPSGVTALALFSSGLAITNSEAASFGDDSAFLRQHTKLIVLSDQHGSGRVAIAPAWQGRVMTSSSGGDAGLSYG